MSAYTPPPMPRYLVAEIAARAEYDALPWWERLVTPPPVGLPGRYAARVGAWCTARVRRRPETEEDES
jgi:hypothetical protein